MTLHVGVTSVPLHPAGVEFVRQAEQLGVDSVWVPEFWAGDAFTPLAYLAASTSTIRLATGIAQLGARTPAMLAMSAQSLQALSGGRFVLGIGTSGPQVMEGWHGVRFDRPVQRTRETIEIIRTITAGERLEHHGPVYDLPLPDGEGRAIRSMMPPAHMPIYVASLGPRQPTTDRRTGGRLDRNRFLSRVGRRVSHAHPEGAARAGRDPAELDLTVAVGVEFTDDVDAAAGAPRRRLRLHHRCHGLCCHNFYNDAFARQGYGDDVREVQRLWQAGDTEAARRRVPDRVWAWHQPGRNRRPDPRSAAPLSRRRHHHPPRRAAWHRPRPAGR